VGLAAGDRIGGPTEMSLCLAESIFECQKLDCEDVGERYLQWWKASGFDTGPTAQRVFELVVGGHSFHTAAGMVNIESGGATAGCNPAHRAAPLAMAPWIRSRHLLVSAVKEARLTHKHQLAGAVSAAVVHLCRRLIVDPFWPTAVNVLDELVFSGLPEMGRANRARYESDLNPGGYAPDVLKAALFFVATSPTFSEALERSIEFAGPSNYCPILVGSIGGARWGASAIPEASLEHFDRRSRAELVADSLANCWSERP
jgi:ADP-ribosyl-[dinitrogen reductase] hydrolase